MIGTSGDFITGLLTGNNSQTPNCCAAAMSGLTSKDLYRLLRSFGIEQGSMSNLECIKVHYVSGHESKFHAALINHMYICIYNFPNSQILLIEFNWGFLERSLVSAVVAPTGLTPDLAWKKKCIYCVNQCWSAYIFRSYQLDSNSKHMRKHIRLRMT